MTSDATSPPSRSRSWFHSPWMSAALLILAAGGGLLFSPGAPPPAKPEFILPSADQDTSAPEPEPPRADTAGSEPAEVTPSPAPVLAVPDPVSAPAVAPKPGWEQYLPVVARPRRQGPDPGLAGVLWSAPAFPKTVSRDIIGLVLDPDRRHAYTFGHVHAAPIHDPKVFLCRWRVDTGRLVWANRLPVDGLPAMAPSSGQLAVPTSHLPIPGATMVWMLDKRTGGFTGWFATPLVKHLIWDNLLMGFGDPSTVHDPLGHLDPLLTRITREADQIQGHTRDLTHLTGVQHNLLPVPFDVVAAAQNHSYILAGGRDRIVHVMKRYGAASRESSQDYARHQHPVTLILCGPPTGSDQEPPRVLSVAFPEVHIWNIQTQELLAFTALPGTPPTSVAVSPNWRYALLGNAQGEVQVVDLATGTRVGEAIKAHTGPVTVAVFAPDWRTAFTVGREDGRLCRLGLPTLE